MVAVAHASFTQRGIEARQRAQAEAGRAKAYEDAVREQAAKETAAMAERIAALEASEARWRDEARNLNAMLLDAGICFRSPRMAPIAERICKATGFTMEEIRSSRRYARLTVARQAIAYWIARQTGHSLTAIGRFINRDHTTAMHSIAAYPKKRADEGKHRRPLETGKRG